MTSRESFAIGVMRETVAESQGWACEACGGPLGPGMQLGHRIPKNKHNLARYGAHVIHHRLNLAGVCCLACNAAVSIAQQMDKVKELVEKIKIALDNGV